MLPTKLWPAVEFQVLCPPLGALFQVQIARGVAWPSGLRRWFKAPVSSEAWVRIPPLPSCFDLSVLVIAPAICFAVLFRGPHIIWLNGLGV